MPPPAPAIAGFAAPARVDPAVPVWVLLDHLIRHDPDHYRAVPDGLDFTGRVRGMLLTETWTRSARGLWLATVHYAVAYADQRPERRIFRYQLIPAYALQQRHDNGPLGGN